MEKCVSYHGNSEESLGQDAENFSCSVWSFASEVQSSVINYLTTAALVISDACYLSLQNLLPHLQPFCKLLINVSLIHLRVQFSPRQDDHYY